MWRQRSQNKYNAQSHIFNGVSYHSKKEAFYAAELEIRKKAGDISDWERQVKISLDVNGYHIANYYVDFRVTYPDGIIEYVEVKGFETPEWKLKWKLFEAIFSSEKNTRLVVVK